MGYLDGYMARVTCERILHVGSVDGVVKACLKMKSGATEKTGARGAQFGLGRNLASPGRGTAVIHCRCSLKMKIRVINGQATGEKYRPCCRSKCGVVVGGIVRLLAWYKLNVCVKPHVWAS